jgi:TRAP-type C4-dicarboxylate transport system substrate-binding protein
MENPVCIAGWEAFGTVPTPMPFTEVFTSLETGVIDGGEHPIWAYLSSREYELAPYYAATNHQWGVSVALLSKKTWDSFNSADQEIIMEAADAARDYAMDKLVATVAKTTETLTAAGVTFTYPDVTEFIEACKPAMAPFEEDIGSDFIAYIRNL